MTVEENSLDESVQSVPDVNDAPIEPISPRDNISESNMHDHLLPLDEDKKMSIVLEWQDEFTTENMKLLVCAVCSRHVRSSDSEWVDGQTIDLSLLRNGLLPPEILPRSYNIQAYNMAILNPKGLESKENLGHMRICGRCLKSLKSAMIPKFALSNWLYYGQESLPDDVKAAFEQSTLFDRKLVARARCNTVTCRFNSRESEESESLNGTILSKARKGIRGNVMVAPLDIVRMNKVIPPSSESIRDTLCAVFVGQKVPTRSSINKYTPVLVRKSRVKKIIQFLLLYNRHYRPSTDFTYSDENLTNLFHHNEDEGIPSAVHVGYIPSNDAIDSTVADYTSHNNDSNTTAADDDELLMENVGYTDGDDSPVSYQTMKGLALERCLQGKPFIVSGKGSNALPDFNNPSILTWLFPHLDPWGVGGFYHPARIVKISMEEQLSHLLMIDDSPFEKDPEFAFVFYNVCRKALVARSLRFTVAERLHREVVNNLLSIDPDVLAKLNQAFMKDPYYRPGDEKEKQAVRLLASLRMASKHVPGSDGYKTIRRNEIRAVINAKGTPTLFITLNPSDVDNPLVRLLAGEDIKIEDVSRGEDMTAWKRKLYAAKNPAACALFFDLFISRFISIILRYGQDDEGLYGRCEAYYGIVEAQGKGTLHCHMLVWLKGHLSPQKLRDKMVESDDYARRVFRWLESVIKCEFPNTRSVDEQKRQYPHRVLHKESGDPHPGVVFPPIAKSTSDASEFWRDFNETLVGLLHHYSWHVHQATCWKYIERGQERTDENCRMGISGETREETMMDEDSKAILLRRHHPRIAPYTDVVTFLLQCNMDIKFVGSGTAAKAFLYYVTDYITKPSLPVHAGMVALAYAVKRIHEKMPDKTDQYSDKQAAGAVITAVNSMMGRQEISHPQVMSYLVGGGDHYTSEKFSVLHWGTIRSFVQRGYQGASEHGIDLAGIEFENPVSLTLGSKTITASSQQLDYVFRGHDPRLSELCLYDFVATTYKVRFGKESCLDTLTSFTSEQHPQKHTHYLSIRRQRQVPVLLGPNIPNPSSGLKDDWARDMLILFKPWRHLSNLKNVDESWIQAFDRCEPLLSKYHKQIISNMRVLTECSDARDNHRRSRHGPVLQEDDNQTIAIRDGEGQEHVLNVSELYQFDPFQGLDQDDRDEIRPDEGDLLSEDTSRLLNMCLPVSMEDVSLVARSCIPSPALVSDEDREDILRYSAFMTSKRKRLRVDPNDEDLEPASNRRRTEMSGPISSIVTLRNSFRNRDEQSNRQICKDVAVDMALERNIEQLRAFNAVADHMMERKTDQLLMHVAGVGGTGKSHVIKSIVTLFERAGRRQELLLGAPTGIAAVLIGGQTLHSLALLTPNSKARNLAQLARIWKNVRYLIVDEVSMVGARFLSQLSSRIRQGKGDDPFNSGKPFGGVNVIFMGDLGQLKPPRQHALYANELVQNPSFPQARNENGVSSLNGAFLWRQVTTVIELTKNQRHREDPVYADFLSRLRVGESSNVPVAPLKVSDLEYLKTRLMEYQASDPSVMEAFRDAPIIVGSKALRDFLNVKLVKYHARRLGSELHIYYSRDYMGKNLISGNLQRKLWGLPSNINQEAFGRLPLFIGMKVMVTENLVFDNGIVNGSEGVVVDIKYEGDGEERRYASVVYVKISGCGIHLEGLQEDVVPIFPVATRINHSSMLSVLPDAKSFTRKQLPLVPAYVYTDFKGQGRTLTRVIVDLMTARGQGVYVMLSRVKTLSGLLILRWFPPTKVYHRLSQDLRNELSRLHDLASTTEPGGQTPVS